MTVLAVLTVLVVLESTLPPLFVPQNTAQRGNRGGFDGFGGFSGHGGFSHDGYPPSTQPPFSEIHSQGVVLKTMMICCHEIEL